ncbi:hypothetical protein ONZ51_g12635 [Trametes cubensis]|uniref:Uncharacterized protein n=1 Tax=Trametes cubensis TaxID=1111947 RepID=A0AAD7TG60_9APHY|nr:hypothetical protein ONZ51_g12635 [Trametes cubensis]
MSFASIPLSRHVSDQYFPAATRDGKLHLRKREVAYGVFTRACAAQVASSSSSDKREAYYIRAISRPTHKASPSAVIPALAVFPRLKQADEPLTRITAQCHPKCHRHAGACLCFKTNRSRLLYGDDRFLASFQTQKPEKPHLWMDLNWTPNGRARRRCDSIILLLSPRLSERRNIQHCERADPPSTQRDAHIDAVMRRCPTIQIKVKSNGARIARKVSQKGDAGGGVCSAHPSGEPGEGRTRATEQGFSRQTSNLHVSQVSTNRIHLPKGLSSPSSDIMQFKLATFATLAAAVATFAPSALAASCFSQSGCPNCESKSSVFAARQQFCGSDDWSHSSSLSWGWAHVTLDGEFATQQECWDGFEQIIDQCYGSKDGGVYNFDFNGKSARLDVGFCNCE